MRRKMPRMRNWELGCWMGLSFVEYWAGSILFSRRYESMANGNSSKAWWSYKDICASWWLLVLHFWFELVLQSPRGTYDPSEKRLITIKKFISVVDELCLPSFRIVDLEQVIVHISVRFEKKNRTWTRSMSSHENCAWWEWNFMFLLT